MQIKLITIGNAPPRWVAEGFEMYVKRLPRGFLQLFEIPLKKRAKNSTISLYQQEEGEKMLVAIPPRAMVVALDEKGEQWDTRQLAAQLAQWMQNTPTVALLIGGPEGLTVKCRERADRQWALSRLTFPHALARVMVAEQLYRAWTILTDHPYHRD